MAVKNKIKKICIFGGYGSQNLSKLIRHTERKELERISQSKFVDFFPIQEIEISGDYFSFRKEVREKRYTFTGLFELFNAPTSLNNS